MKPEETPCNRPSSDDLAFFGNAPDVSDDGEVLALGWAAIDGSADQAAIERLGQLVKSQPKAKEAFESILALDRGLHTLFGTTDSAAAVQLPGNLSMGS